MTQACSSNGASAADAAKVPEPKADIQSAELRTLIHDSDRPFVLMNFFATWCKPCRTEMPELVAMQHDPQSEVKVLLVSIDHPETLGDLQGFLADQGVDFQTYARPVDEGALITEFYPFWNNRIPLSLIFQRDGGHLLEAITGLTDRSEVELLINKHKHLGTEL